MNTQAALASALDLHKAGRLTEADAAYRRIPENSPEIAEAYFLRGVIAYQDLRPNDAIPLMEKAIALQPAAGHFYLDLGNALHAGERLIEAIKVMQRVLAFDRHSEAATHNLGCVALDLAKKSLLLRDAAHLAEAEQAMRVAMAIGPGVPEAHQAHGSVAFSQGLCVPACTAFHRTVAVKPDLARAWSDYLFVLCFRDDVSREEVLAAHKTFDVRHMRSIPKLPPRSPVGEDPMRQLTVGYISPDLRTHPGGNFLTPMFTHHDRASFRLIAYYSNDVEDSFTRLCSAHADAWVPCKDMSDQDLADRVRRDGVDILVECAGHMARNRLAVFARRPAPIQVSFPLYPNTTGLETIDYRIGDPHFTPPWLDRFYSEKIIRLPDIHECYLPGQDDAAPPEAPPALANGFLTFGSFNNIAKLSRTTLRMWAAILTRVPSARLVIKWFGLDRNGPHWLVDRLRAAGIDRNRVQFLGRTPSIYAPYREIDICLDPFPANGGTTTCDALWMGVPVVTRVGETTFSRVGLGMLTNIRLPELIAHDEAGYVDLAVSLAVDLDRLARLRHGLRQRFMASPLMDGPRYVRNLEAAYRQVWRDWCAGGA